MPAIGTSREYLIGHDRRSGDDILFQFRMDFVSPFAIVGRAFSLGRHVIRPHEILQTFGTTDFMHFLLFPETRGMYYRGLGNSSIKAG